MLALHASLQSAINAGTARTAAQLLRIERPTGIDEFYTDHIHNVLALSETWEANGLWLGVSTIRATGSNSDETWTFDLDATNGSVVNAGYDGGQAWYYIAYLSGTTGAVLGDPVLLGHGDLSDDDDEEALDRAVRRLRVHSLLWPDQFEATQYARTHRAHIGRYPGDNFYKQTASLARTSFRVGGVKSFRD